MVEISETAPTQGTLRVFPDVLLSNAYIILRPFFSPTVPSNSKDIYDANNWKFGKSWQDKSKELFQLEFAIQQLYICI